MILYRPVGTAELELIKQSGYRSFPPRLPEQPIFYPVLNEKYAREIAENWNVKSAQDRKGYVTRFEVDDDYISGFDVQTVGRSYHQELWIPAEELDNFNSHIIGRIEVAGEYSGGSKLIALLVIDAQELLTNEKLYAFENFRDSVSGLISEARRIGVEVIYVRHDDGECKPLSKGNDGYEVYEGFAPQTGERIFDKTVNSPFRDSGLLEYLREKGIEKLIVTGLQTDYCIDSTVKCGFEHGFEMIVPEYCNTTFDNAYMSAEQTYRYYNDLIWNNRYAKCVTINEVLEMIRSR